MPVLAMDTSTPALSVAVVAFDRDRPVALPASRASRRVVDARAHAELLTPLVSLTLADAGVAGGDLDAVVVGRGPGPYTGLRVGMVTAATLASGLGVPVYGVCSLDGLVPEDASVERWAAVTDARRREVYWAVYEGTPPGGSEHGTDPDAARGGAGRTTPLSRCIAGPGVGRPSDLAEVLAELRVRLAVGAGAEAYAEAIGVPVAGPAYPDPVALAAVAARRVLDRAPSEPPEPLYLRRPDVHAPGPRKSVLTGAR